MRVGRPGPQSLREVVILGTIATAAGEALCLAPVRARVEEQVWPSLGGKLQILPSGLGPRLGDLAGVCVAQELVSDGSPG